MQTINVKNMKVIKSLFDSRLRLILFSSVLVLIGISGCKQSGWEDEVAQKKTLVNTLAITEGPVVPLLKGRDTTLTARFNPEQVTNSRLVWKSADEAIAKVNQNGVVTTIGLGTTKISVESADGGGRKAEIDLTVIDRVIYATAITLNRTTLTTYPKVATQITATAAPVNVTYPRMLWASSNPAVATVDANGLVTGLAPGSATITVRPADGSAARATLSVTVIEIVPIQTITINTVLTDGMAVDERLLIDYSVTPALASKQLVTFSSSDETVATVTTTGVITALKVGQAVITITSADGGNIKATLNIDVKEGKINDSFMDGFASRWTTSTTGASVAVQNNSLMVTMNTGTNRRGDFRRANTTLDVSKYPIIAFKFIRPLATGGNVFFDTSLGRWKQTTGNGNNSLASVTGRDGLAVYYADLGAFNTFGTAGNTMPTTGPYTFTQITVGVADMPTASNPLSPYPVYWIKTFKTVAELQAYIN